MIDLNQTGGTAFPIKEPLNTDCLGMTLRDYFAAKAMQAYLSDPKASFADDALEATSYVAYRVADAMLKARSI